MQFIPKKLYYKIGEVCEIVGVEAHVLRYWETEFPALTPPKNKGGQRTYRPSDIDLLLRIRGLLYEDGFTIAGARKQLARRAAAEDGEPGALPAGPARRAAQTARRRRATASRGSGDDRTAQAESPKEDLRRVRRELENILTLLERG